MIETIIHTFRHITGLCGEEHPSLLVGGTAFFTYVVYNVKTIILYVKQLVKEIEL